MKMNKEEKAIWAAVYDAQRNTRFEGGMSIGEARAMFSPYRLGAMLRLGKLLAYLDGKNCTAASRKPLSAWLYANGSMIG